MSPVHDTVQIEVSSSGAVPPDLCDYARDKLGRAIRFARRPVLRAGIRLRIDPNPALERPAIVKAWADVGGRMVRGHVAARDMHEAIDLVERRVQRGVDALAGRAEGRYHQTGSATPGEWRHGDVPAPQPEFYPRPADERTIVRRKTPALETMAPERAIDKMTLLDHDFLLFVDAESGGDAVVYRSHDDEAGFRLIPSAAEGAAGGEGIPLDPPPSTMRLEDAVGLLDLSGERFVFFVERASGRGAVLYRRYDGHYGLVTPGAAG